MKAYKNFMIILLIIDIILLGLMYFRSEMNKNISERTNTECLLEERVFDYAEKLSITEEDKLRTFIDQDEKKIGADIILITIDDENINTSEKLMNYVNGFYDENKFGWNKPCGDGIIYVDNWATNQVWVSTSGKMQNIYTDNMINKLINEVCENVNEDIYESYKLYSKIIVNDVLGGKINFITLMISIGVSIIISIIFIFINCFNLEGEDTTTKSTYVNKNDFKIVRKNDNFLTENIIRVKVGSSDGQNNNITNSRNSHSGGGGSH